MFKTRSTEAEIMDDFHLQGEIMDKTLKELEVINKWLGGDYVTIKGIERLLKNQLLDGKTVTIADLGCGGGDMLIKIAKWARRKSIKVNLFGIDANDYIIEYGKKNAADYPEIEFISINIFSAEFKLLRFDIITSTLFTHHFTDKELVKLYGQLSSQANYGILTNDIHRHWLAYRSINLLTGLFSKSEMVKNDAGVSVKRSFLKSELEEILKLSSIKHYKIKWMWAFRWQVIIITEEAKNK